MKTFRALKAAHEFRRRHLPFLQTLEDVEVLREIGLHQSIERPLTLKTLLLQGVGSAATVQRRLSRLKRLGAVHQARSGGDKRVLELTVNPAVWKQYQRLGKLMRKALA
jgi:hypothetical protein